MPQCKTHGQLIDSDVLLLNGKVPFCRLCVVAARLDQGVVGVIGLEAPRADLTKIQVRKELRVGANVGSRFSTSVTPTHV